MNATEYSTRTDYCAYCGEFINVWICEEDEAMEDGGVWHLSKISTIGSGTFYAEDGNKYHAFACDPASRKHLGKQ